MIPFYFLEGRNFFFLFNFQNDDMFKKVRGKKEQYACQTQRSKQNSHLPWKNEMEIRVGSNG